MMAGVSYIPLGVPFLRTLATRLLAQIDADPAALTRTELLLPTRRACRMMSDLFLDLTNGRPILLPRLRAIGDIDDQELELMVTAATGKPVYIPPAISKLERQLILADLLRARDTSIDYARALQLAKTLASFFDTVQDEGCDLENLSSLVGAEFATHWQLTLDFLDIIRVAWPAYLQAAGVMDPGARRGLLLEKLRNYWRDHPPIHPIIIAGVTGSLPRVADLMRVVAGLPQGQVILAGYDPDLPNDVRDALDDQHPQFELYRVIDHMNVAPHTITRFDDGPQDYAIQYLWRQVMLPGESAKDWADLARAVPSDFRSGLDRILNRIQIIEAETPGDEAIIVATAIRLALTDPRCMVAVVTPDRRLASGICAACARFGIDVNDSAGIPVIQTLPGKFLNLVLDIARHGIRPISFLSLLRHPLLNADLISNDEINYIDQFCLRGLSPPSDIQRFIDHLRKMKCDDVILCKIQSILDIFTPLMNRVQNPAPFHELIRAHVMCAEKLSLCIDNVPSLWDGESGEVLVQAIGDLLTVTDVPRGDINIATYHDILNSTFADARVNIRGVGHPRVALLGIFESRLIHADHVILCGFNDGIWPRDAGVDPWLSRGMRRDFGLPSLDRAVGRTALDFLQLVHAEQVTITRAKRVDGMATLPSRWLERLDTVMRVMNPGGAPHRNRMLPEISANLDKPAHTNINTKRPHPRPPTFLRPVTYSATQIENLIHDPYAFYAQKILRLYPIDPHDMPVDDCLRGNILHAVLDIFTAQYPRDIPKNAEDIMGQILRDQFDAVGVARSDQIAMTPRMRRALHLYLGIERKWRADGNETIARESSWHVTIAGPNSDFTIAARLDRLDILPDGTYAIFDYKTGSHIPSRTDVVDRIHPQLPIQVLVVEQGKEKYNTHLAGDVACAGYWQVIARDPKITSWTIEDDKNNIQQLKNDVVDGVRLFLATMCNDQIPYLPTPDPELDLGYDDYHHLNRREMWYGLDDEIDEASS